jgi:hypothetical protein
MSAATQGRLRLVPSPRRPERDSEGRTYLWIVAAVALATLAAIASIATSGRRGLAGVPPEQRAALLSRTVDELRQFCGAGRAAALEDHCRELASFAARFEECSGECERLVRPYLTPTPTR